jgi:hypothetical protein
MCFLTGLETRTTSNTWIPPCAARRTAAAALYGYIYNKGPFDLFGFRTFLVVSLIAGVVGVFAVVVVAVVFAVVASRKRGASLLETGATPPEKGVS